MSLNVWIKRKMADRVLLPLRNELIDLIEENSTLLDVGCGTGDLLFHAADKIRTGYGVDIDQRMIEHAELRRKRKNLNNLEFECIDAKEIAPRWFDIATSTLCLHELPKQHACDLLKLMLNRSRMALIADYTTAKGMLGKISMECDELASGHYRNYKNYRNVGEVPAYADIVGASVNREIRSAIDGISIWCVVPNAKNNGADFSPVDAQR